MSRTVDTDHDVSRTDSVPESARVRHFDELDDSAQEYVAHAARGISPQETATLSGLSEGDVVVFTDHFHVQ
jgi:hypothetical protein